MAKAPSTAASFDGSGSVWFKILDIGPKFPGGTWDLKRQYLQIHSPSAYSHSVETYAFTVPSCIPAGEYLIRIQQIGIHNPTGGVPQFYIGCAQVKVTGGGSKDLGPKVAIPGAFKSTDPGLTANIYNNFNSYTVPGPAVATC